MARGSLHTVVEHLRQLAGYPATDEATDRELLSRFLEHRDEAAFATLVRRHEPMIRGLCCRLLTSPADVDDTCQAVFLVLVRKARSLRKQESLAGWLHGVAYRVVLNARREAARRAERERRAARPPVNEPSQQAAWRELCRVLDEELHGLAEAYRAPLVLCYLEGQTRDEAARHLGVSLRTLGRRLERGRKLLRGRLERRGLSLSVAFLSAGLAQPAPSAGAANALAASVANAGGRAATAAVSDRATLLAEACLRVMASKGKLVATLFVVLGLAAIGGGLLARQALLSHNGPPRSASRPGGEVQTKRATDLFGDPLPPGALARMGTVRLRHSGAVSCVAYSPDGKLLASGSYDGTVRLWDPVTGLEVKRFVMYPPDPKSGQTWHWVTGLAFAPDGKTIACSGGNYGADPLRLYDVTTGREVRRIANHARNNNGVAFSPDGRLVAAASADKAVRLFLVAAGTQVAALLGHTDEVCAVTFSPDGRTLASGGADQTLRLWNVSTGREYQRLGGFQERVAAVAFSPRGDKVAAGSWDGTVRLFDTVTGKVLTSPADRSVRVYAVAFSPDGKQLVSAGIDRGDTTDNAMYLWDVATGKCVRRFVGNRGLVAAVAFAPDGRTLASGDGNNGVRLWQTANGREILHRIGQNGSAIITAFSPDGKSLYTQDGGNGQVHSWDVRSGRPLDQLGDRSLHGRWAALNADGRLLALGGERPARVSLWDVPNGRRIWQRTIENGRYEPIVNGAMAPDGSRLAVVATHRILVFDCATHKEMWRLASQTEKLTALAFAPDGLTLAAGYWGRGVWLWDMRTGKELGRFPTPPGPVYCMRFSEPSRLVVVGMDIVAGVGTRPVQVWDLRTRQLRREFHLASDGPVTLSPDGRRLAGICHDHAIRIWELATGREILQLRGAASPYELLFSADGRLLASANSDTTALVWDATGMGPSGDEPIARLSERQLDSLWHDLGSADAGAAWRAVWRLTAAGAQAVALCDQRLRIAQLPDARRISKLVADLDDRHFAVRERATAELMALGDSAVPALRAVLVKKPSPEVRRRVERLLAMRTGPMTAPAKLQAWRALAVLEQLGTPAARAVLKRLAGGPAEADFTQEAKASLERVNRRAAVSHP